jgi:hypothetical protein
MLNRKLSEYIFYGSLALITIIVLLANTIVMGNINDRIETTNQENIALQTQIDELTEIVQENKNSQTSFIYELYDQVPGVYNGTELTYETISILERLGITESNDYGRNVLVEDSVYFGDDSIFFELSQSYKFVEVEVFFTTQDAQLVADFLDAMYNSNQIFIINEITYRVPDGEDYLGITINLLAMYDVEEIEEESN